MTEFPSSGGPVVRRTVTGVVTALVLAGGSGVACANDGGEDVVRNASHVGSKAGMALPSAANTLAQRSASLADKTGIDRPLIGPGDLGRGPYRS
ncbi:hypothetical protein [Streptomyces sp. NPDC048172]|uniref:hypothetical protein n=1 Tax=Streptomyces sp. NPDC048172 TaxID=3365505 RepID=UPI003719A2A0